jgi:DNA replication protein DnaC
MPDATFDNFKLNYYSDKSEDESKAAYSPRQNARLVLKVCKDFCINFEQVSYNLLFSGNTGVGKTFFSSAIAHKLIDSGYDVVYETAGTIFSLLEDIRFNRANDDESRHRADRLLECDLLIIDDLGAEFITQFVVSALFNLINSRILYNKKMIISTNYSKDDIENVYGSRILSRLLGDFKILTLFGQDIRIIKKGL